MTLAASPEDVPGLLLAGAHDCVVKPFGADELQVRLDALSPAAVSTRAARPRSPASTAPSTWRRWPWR